MKLRENVLILLLTVHDVFFCAFWEFYFVTKTFRCNLLSVKKVQVLSLCFALHYGQRPDVENNSEAKYRVAEGKSF